MFIARTVHALGPGGQRVAERALGWNRATIRKGLRELRTGAYLCRCLRRPGRHPAAAHLPHLLDDLHTLMGAPS